MDFLFVFALRSRAPHILNGAVDPRGATLHRRKPRRARTPGRTAAPRARGACTPSSEPRAAACRTAGSAQLGATRRGPRRSCRRRRSLGVAVAPAIRRHPSRAGPGPGPGPYPLGCRGAGPEAGWACRRPADSCPREGGATCVRARARACVRACVHVCLRACMCVRARAFCE